MLAVSGAESVHHVYVCVRCQLLGEVFLATFHLLLGCVILGGTLLYAYGLAFLLGVVAQVLQQQSLSGLQRGGFGVSVAAILGELHFHAQCVAYVLYDLGERQLGLYLAFGLAHVAHHNQRATIVQHFLQRGKRAADAGVVCYVTILVQGHIEVHTDNCLMTGKVKVFDFHCIMSLVLWFTFARKGSAFF